MSIIERNNNEEISLEKEGVCGTPIQKFYARETIFITGATGFLGKVLVEKLLRSCPDLSKIYLLIRPKQGKDVNSRMDELLKNSLWDRLKDEQPNFREKVVPLNGDCSVEGLGLSDEDRDLVIRETSIVFHVAATVRFDEKLDYATRINVRSTREILDMCKRMEKLKSCIHVSTAYANCTLKKIDECVYEYSVPHEKLVTLVESLPEDKFEKKFSNFSCQWPNTYTFTKAMAEILIKEKNNGLPIGIFRPAIAVAMYVFTGVLVFFGKSFLAISTFLLTFLKKITLSTYTLMQEIIQSLRDEDPVQTLQSSASSGNRAEAQEENETYPNRLKPIQVEEYPVSDNRFVQLITRVCFDQMTVTSADREPAPGWTDSFYGATGLALAGYLGALKLVQCDGKAAANIVPVDLTVNALIASAWDVYTRTNRRDDSMLVYNYVSSADARLTWAKFCRLGQEASGLYPTQRSLWHQSITLIKNKFLFTIATWIIHLIPALIVDAVLICIGRKPKMWKIYKKVRKTADIVVYFTLRDWELTNYNVRKMWHRLDKKDQQLFHFSMKEFSWEKYFHVYFLGMRSYLLNESPESIPACRIRSRRLYWLHEAVKTAIVFGILTTALKVSSIFY